MSEEKFAKLDSLKKCPLCEGELEKGYLHAPEGAFWDTKKHKMFTALAEKLISRWSWTMPMASGLRCKECKIVIIHYREKKE